MLAVNTPFNVDDALSELMTIRLAESSDPLDTLEYSLDDNLPNFMRGDLTQNFAATEKGQIITAIGLFLQLIPSLVLIGFIPTFLGFTSLILTLGSSAAWVYAYMAYLNSKDAPSDKSTFRSWKVNFAAFWIYGSVSLLNLIFVIFKYGIRRGAPLPAGATPGPMTIDSAPPTGKNPVFDFWFDAGVFLFQVFGLGLTNYGIFVDTRIKQIWLYFDPQRKLASEPFDYFGEDTQEESGNDTVVDTLTNGDDSSSKGATDSGQTTETTTSDGKQTTTDSTSGQTNTNGNGEANTSTSSSTTGDSTTTPANDTSTTTETNNTSTTNSSTDTSTTTSPTGTSTTTQTSGTSTNTSSTSTSTSTTTPTNGSPTTTATTTEPVSTTVPVAESQPAPVAPTQRRGKNGRLFDVDHIAVAF